VPPLAPKIVRFMVCASRCDGAGRLRARFVMRSIYYENHIIRIA
jgi:hypothetical protein